MTEPLIQILETPNPDAYMFRINEMLIPSGTHEFKQGDPIDLSPLASVILAIPSIELILIAPRFITVRKHTDATWQDLKQRVTQALELFLNSGEMAVFEQPKTAAHTNLTELERQVLELLNEEVRPAIAMDGGDFVYHGISEGIVKIELIGACGSCPSSTATLHNGIQNLLIEEFPQLKGVEQVHSS